MTLTRNPPGQPRSIIQFVATMLMVSACLLMTPALGNPPPQDTELEERLDEYINILTAPAEERKAFLDDIIADLDRDTPIATRVRAIGYQALESTDGDDEELTQSLAEKLQTLAEASEHPDVEAEARAFYIELLWRQGEAEEAMVQVPQLEAVLPEVYAPRIRYYAYNLAARLLSSHSQHEDALQHYLEAYDAAREMDDERTQIRRQFLNFNIAQLQADLRNYDQALDIAQRGIRLAKEEGLDAQLPQFLLLQGYIFSQMEDHEGSIESHEEAIRHAEELEQSGVVLTSLNNIGSAQIHLERYEEATETLERAYTMALELGQEQTQSLLEFNLAYLNIMQGGGNSAIEAMEAAKEELADHYSQSNMADLLELVAEAYREAGMLEEAIDALIRQRELNSELFQAERDKSLSELQTRYETREQATEIELLEQRNELQERVIQNNQLQQRITILFVMVVILSLILLWQAYKSVRRANRKLTEVNQELEYQSVHDALTGLLNRRSFQKEMQQRGSSGIERRAQPYPDALLLLDVDFFKRINDEYGHAGGDAVLKELAERLKAISRTSDMVIRWGGEEILMFLRNMDPDALADYAARVLDAIGSEPIEYEGDKIRVTATGGFIQLPLDDIPEDKLDWERALNIADMALYIGKTHGRNRAIGILGLNRPFDELQEVLSEDLAHAVERDLVKHTLVRGPKKKS